MGNMLCLRNTVQDGYNPASYSGGQATIFIQPLTNCVTDTAFIRYARPDGGIEGVFGFVQTQYGAATADFVIQGSSCGYSEKLRIAGNYVGIGTCTPCSPLDVYKVGSGGAGGAADTLILRGGNNNNIFTSNQLRLGYAGGIGYSHVIKTRHNSGGNTDNALDFFLWTTADAVETPGTKNVMTLTGTGAVGVGTCSPNISGFTGTMLTLNGTGNYQGLEIATSGTARMTMLTDSVGSLGYISTRQAGMSLIFEAGAASEKMRITSTGNVGIGTSSPNKLLDVRGDSYFYSSNTAYSEGISVFANSSAAGINFHCAPSGTTASSTTLKGYLRVNQTGTCLLLGVFPTADIVAMSVNVANGNINFSSNINATSCVGIGTTSPADKLHVIGADNGITICSSSANRPVFSLYNGSSLMLKLSANGVYGAIADNSGSDVMYFKGGCVSIGTSSPSYKLHVNGTFYAAGSSQDYKQSICNYNTDSCMFMKLKPVTYDYKEEWKHLGKELKSGTQIGLIAEEVAESHPELAILVNEENEKIVRNVDYEKLTIILLSELQKLRQEVDQLKNK